MDILLLGITDPNLTIDLKYQYISYIEEKTIKNSKVLLCHLYRSPIYFTFIFLCTRLESLGNFRKLS